MPFYKIKEKWLKEKKYLLQNGDYFQNFQEQTCPICCQLKIGSKVVTFPGMKEDKSEGNR